VFGRRAGNSRRRYQPKVQMRLLLAALFAVATAWWSPAAGQSLPRFGAPEPHVAAELISATDAVVPGQPLTLGLKLTHEKDWHTYWLVPGDSGLPTRIEWSLPAGFEAGPIEWPHPKRMPTGPLVNFGYEGETLLLTTVRVPDNLPAGSTVTLSGKAEWLECKDVCIPADADISITLPVRANAGPSKWAALFTQTRAKIPQLAGDISAQGTIEDNRIRVALTLPAGKTLDRVEFFPTAGRPD
jgi:DsbC/DsbD-like thiol-disulfide interchange protein